MGTRAEFSAPSTRCGTHLSLKKESACHPTSRVSLSPASISRPASRRSEGGKATMGARRAIRFPAAGAQSDS
jgi:hypothetical protein